MSRERAWRWLKSAGWKLLSSVAFGASISYCVPPPQLIQAWPADAELWTPETGQRLTAWERRSWSDIERRLREELTLDD